jgi:glyceraldehyde-3-phosphate dehydrogenase (ferredoxin)
VDVHQKALSVDAGTGFYRIARYPSGDFFGPVDLGLHLAGKFNSLNIGVGLLAGSILPGSNRLIFSGFSTSWGGFYVSTMGGAGLAFDNLGINMVSLRGKAPTPSILYLNRTHGEEIEVRLETVDLRQVWTDGRGGIYSLMDHVFERDRLGDEKEAGRLLSLSLEMPTKIGLPEAQQIEKIPFRLGISPKDDD